MAKNDGTLKKTEHASSSKVQKQIEAKIIKAMNLESKPLVTEGISFHFDGYTNNIDTLVEVYCGLDTMKAGQVRKLSHDIHKMLTYEKLVDQSVAKKLIVVSEPIKQALSEGKSWLAKSLEVHRVEVVLWELSNKDMAELRAAKARQSSAMRK